MNAQKLDHHLERAQANHPKAAHSSFRKAERIIAYVDSHIAADTRELFGSAYKPNPFR